MIFDLTEWTRRVNAASVMTQNNTIILIPARLASTRLPNKPLADIAGKPMIWHVWQRAQETGLGQAVVAAADPEIADAITQAGGQAVLTDPSHPSGSDRIYEALQKIDPDKTYDIVINFQGDEPITAPHLIHSAHKLMDDPSIDIATLAAPIKDEKKRTNPAVVKAIAEIAPGQDHGRALYFTRAAAPTGEGDLLHHIGLYVYRRPALEKFVSSPPAELEKREKLEQLRALALGMRIELGIVDDTPLGVDTPEDLEEARRLIHAYMSEK